MGIGFAIPINLARGIIEQLKSSGVVTRGWLGVSIQDLTSELADYYGVKNGKGALVGDVFKGDPADKAGIMPKDVIIEVEGKKIEDSRDLSRTIAEVPVGEKVLIKVLRNGKERAFRVKIAKRTDDKEALTVRESEEETGLGMTLSPITPELVRQYDLLERQGVVVVAVEQNGPADKAEVREGDLIIEIDHKPIKTLDDYQKQIKGFKKGETISFLVKRRAALVALYLTK